MFFRKNRFFRGGKGLEEILRISDISFSYDGEKVALNNISVSFNRDEKTVILGKNGSGKTTLFKCCNKVIKPSKGEIYLYGKPIGNNRSDINNLRKSIGLVFQNPDDQIIAGSVFEEISFGPMNLGIPKEEVRNMVKDAMKILNINHLSSRAPQYLSGGEKKMVSIASILSMRPDLILFDEPTSNLDTENILQFEKTLDILFEKKIGIVISTHDVNFAWRWADRIILFHQGEIVMDEGCEEFFSKESLLKKYGVELPILYSVGKRLGLNKIPKKIEDL